VSPGVEETIRARVEAELAEELARRDRTRLGVEDQAWIYRLVGRLVADEPLLDGAQAEEVWRRLFASVTPLGPLAEHLADPDVEEVRINGTEACFVFKSGRRQAVPPPFDNEDALVELVHWYTDGTPSARLDRASPTVTMTLPEGSRLHAALSPPARPMSVTIRKHPPARFADLQALADSGFLPHAVVGLLEAAVEARLNMLVSGGAGAGKTTFMRVLSRLIAADERVVTIEDQAELHLWRELPDCIALEGRPSNTEGRGAITIQMLVHEALRMSPDRIIIGEVRGGEALDLLDAMNTGHPAHAPSRIPGPGCIVVSPGWRCERESPDADSSNTATGVLGLIRRDGLPRAWRSSHGSPDSEPDCSTQRQGVSHRKAEHQVEAPLQRRGDRGFGSTSR